MDNLSPRKIQNIIDSRDRLKKRWEQSKELCNKKDLENKKLQDELKSLKYQLELRRIGMQQENTRNTEIFKEYMETNKKLKDELKSLKYQLELSEQKNTRNTENFKECIEIRTIRNNKLKEELEETTKLKDEFRQKWIEKSAEFVRLVPRSKRGLDARNSSGY
jgi:hypothetical protein